MAAQQTITAARRHARFPLPLPSAGGVPPRLTFPVPDPEIARANEAARRVVRLKLALADLVE